MALILIYRRLFNTHILPIKSDLLLKILQLLLHSLVFRLQLRNGFLQNLHFRLLKLCLHWYGFLLLPKNTQAEQHHQSYCNMS